MLSSVVYGMKLSNRIALITGANRGIGRGIAGRLAGEGAVTVVNYPFAEHQGEAEQAVAEIDASGGQAIAIRADIADHSQRQAMFARIEKEYGRLDILVNNAAYDPGTIEFLDVDEAFYDRMMAVNLKGAYFCAQAAARLMIGMGSGRIINISSVHGQQNFPNYGPYSVTKGGLNALTRQAAIDLAQYSITVNAVAPGFVEVARATALIPNYDRETIARRMPLRRVGFPTDIAAIVCFLASDEARYITGQVIAVDGGITTFMGFQ